MFYVCFIYSAWDLFLDFFSFLAFSLPSRVWAYNYYYVELRIKKFTGINFREVGCAYSIYYSTKCERLVHLNLCPLKWYIDSFIFLQNIQIIHEESLCGVVYFHNQISTYSCWQFPMSSIWCVWKSKMHIHFIKVKASIGCST